MTHINFHKIYLAGPLFTKPEQDWNEALSKKLNKIGCETFLPQVECKRKSQLEIFQTRISGIDSCDLILANVDGTDADSGTCFELGYAYGKQKKIILYRTDFRKCGDDGFTNLMLSKSTNVFLIVKDADELVNKVFCL